MKEKGERGVKEKREEATYIRKEREKGKERKGMLESQGKKAEKEEGEEENDAERREEGKK